MAQERLDNRDFTEDDPDLNVDRFKGWRVLEDRWQTGAITSSNGELLFTSNRGLILGPTETAARGLLDSLEPGDVLTFTGEFRAMEGGATGTARIQHGEHPTAENGDLIVAVTPGGMTDGTWRAFSVTYTVPTTPVSPEPLFVLVRAGQDAFGETPGGLRNPSLMVEYVNPPPEDEWEIKPLPAQAVVAGEPVSIALELVDPPNAGVAWSADGLPDGLTVVPTTNGARIQGEATETGEFEVTVSATVDSLTKTAELELTVLDAPPPGGNDVWEELDALADELAPRIARHVGRAGESEVIELAKNVLPVVVEFVRGYTRGRGFLDGGDGEPEPRLKVVIVSAASRLVMNPEQVRQYSASDYSETPALLTAWTLVERSILHRYRKTWA